MILSIALVLLAVFLTGVSQMLLKVASHKKKTGDSALAVYLNWYSVSAYVIFLIVTVISVIALIEVPLKLFNTLQSLNFVIVAVLSWLFLHERISKRMMIAFGLICTGIVIFAL